MNRRFSSDSLDNDQNDMIVSSGSSSPTDFSSDDETIRYNGLYTSMISGQPLNKVKKNPHQSVKDKNTNFCSNFGTDIALNVTTSLNLNDQKQNQPTTSLADVNNFNDHLGPSTSWLNYDPASQTGSGTAETVSPLIDQTWERRPDSLFDGNYMRRLLQDRENIIDNQDKYALYNKSSPLVETPAGSMNPITVRLCAKLVECRTLHEAMEFISCERDLIDNLTRIVTHDAPAYRNYDLNNYQVDNSVKDSFNPNFWLDREPIVTTADGNCQYHAVSISLTGSEMYTPEVRLATAVAVVDNREYFDSILKLIDRGTVLDLIREIARCYSWGDETTLKAIAVAIKRRIFLYTCNIGKKDFEMVKSLTRDELVDAFKEKKYRGGTGIHTYADPLVHVAASNYIMLFHKSEHFIAVLPTGQQPTMFEPYNPIVPVL